MTEEKLKGQRILCSTLLYNKDNSPGLTLVNRNWKLAQELTLGNSLVVQWLGVRALTAEGPVSMPGQGTKIPQAVWHGQKETKQKNKKQTVLFTVSCVFVLTLR